MSLIKSSKGNDQLLLDGFRYPDRQDSLENALKRVRISLKRRFNEILTYFYALCSP